MNPAEPQAAFANLVERHARFLYRVAYTLLGNRQDAEDAVQEMFMKLFRTQAWKTRMEDERAYLARAVWRCGLDRLANAQEKALRHAEDVAEPGHEPVSSAASPEEQAMENSERALMHSLIAGLPEEQRTALVLSAVDEMRPKDVAAVLSIAEATVRTRVHRAKAELRRRFAELNATAGVRP